MTGPAFMWRLAGEDEVAHFVLYGDLVVRRFRSPAIEQVTAVPYTTPAKALKMALWETRDYEERNSMALTAMYVIENPDQIGVTDELRKVQAAYLADSNHLEMLAINVFTVFTVAGEVLYA